MNIQAKSKSGKVSDEVRVYAARKLGKLRRHFHRDPDVHYAQSFEHGLHVVEITVVGDGVLMRSQARHADLKAAVDTAVEKMDTQASRFKEKRISRHRLPSPMKHEAQEAADYPAPSGSVPAIVRRKRFPMKPLLPEDAARQMELLGHSFFLFVDADTSRLCVLYRRHNGEYGLIEPDV